MKVFIKVPVTKELPADVQPKNVITNIGYAAYYAPTKKWIDQGALSEVNPDWWLKEVEVPSEEQIREQVLFTAPPFRLEFIKGAEFIIEKLK